MLGTYVATAKANDAYAARRYAWPSRAAFELALAHGGIAMPVHAVKDEVYACVGGVSVVTGALLACDHVISVPPPRGGKPPGDAKKRMRPCRRCAQQRWVDGEPAVAAEYFRWALKRLETAQKEESVSLDPHRRAALEWSRQRYATTGTLRIRPQQPRLHNGHPPMHAPPLAVAA